MELPYVNPVGLVERPNGYRSAPRHYPTIVRLGAAALGGTFLFVSLTTSVVSLAAYCLTSYAGAPLPVGP
jgi:hypothetical protein